MAQLADSSNRLPDSVHAAGDRAGFEQPVNHPSDGRQSAHAQSEADAAERTAPERTSAEPTGALHIVTIAIEETEQGHLVRLRGSAGEATAPFLSPLTAAELTTFWQAVADSQAQLAPPGAVADLARTTGETLYRALLTDEQADLLRQSYLNAYQARMPLQLRLQLDATPEFLTLPWEYLFEPVRQEFPALSLHSPFVRHTQLMHRIRPLPVTGPLRALVVIANPSTHPDFNSRRTWLNLLDTLDYLAADRRLLLARLQKPTLHDLQRQLRSHDYHILHFIGHAQYDRDSQEGRLVFEDEMRRGRLVSGHHLGQMLRDNYATRLVILQAAMEHVDVRNPMGIVAHHLIPRGVPATAMLPFTMPDRLTAAFFHELYAEVAAFKPVDVAMTEARNAMIVEGGGLLWGAPWLLSRMDEGFLFDNGHLPVRSKPRPRRRTPSLLERVLRSNLAGRSFDEFE